MSGRLSTVAFLATSFLAVLVDSSSFCGTSPATQETDNQRQDPILMGVNEDILSPLQRLLLDDDKPKIEEALLEHASRQLNLVECVEEHDVDYFGAVVKLDTQAAPTNCDFADQMMLGHDINLILRNNGVAENEDGTTAVFTGLVCPDGEPSSARRDLLSHHELNINTPVNFIYPGYGVCGLFCDEDNQDARYLKSGEDGSHQRKLGTYWFENTYKPDLEARLNAAIVNDVVPLHQGCLGSNPTVVVEVTGVSEEEARIPCSHHNGDFALLETFNLADILLDVEKAKCDLCTVINFSTKQEGDWIRNDYAADGVEITAYPGPDLLLGGIGGYAPNNAAHIFETSNPIGDPDLGSPNSLCPGGGPGVGIGGGPGTEGENCVPIGSKCALFLHFGSLAESITR